MANEQHYHVPMRVDVGFRCGDGGPWDWVNPLNPTYTFDIGNANEQQNKSQ